MLLMLLVFFGSPELFSIRQSTFKNDVFLSITVIKMTKIGVFSTTIEVNEISVTLSYVD